MFVALNKCWFFHIELGGYSRGGLVGMPVFKAVLWVCICRSKLQKVVASKVEFFSPTMDCWSVVSYIISVVVAFPRKSNSCEKYNSVYVWVDRVFCAIFFCKFSRNFPKHALFPLVIRNSPTRCLTLLKGLIYMILGYYAFGFSFCPTLPLGGVTGFFQTPFFKPDHGFIWHLYDSGGG